MGIDLTQPAARAERDANADRVEALERVKKLTALPNSIYVTTEMVAAYYAVETEAIRQLVVRNRDEVESDGYTVLSGARLSDIKSLSGLTSRAPLLAVFPPRAVLRVGMLLRDSPVALAVRTYLLNVAVPESMDEAEGGDLERLSPEEQAARLTRRDLAAMVIAESDRADAAEAELAVAKPKAEAFDAWFGEEGCYHVATVARMLDLGGQRLWNWLYNEEILIQGGHRHRQPYAPYGAWFRVRANRSDRANGHQTTTTLVTAWGAEQIRLRAIRKGLIASTLMALPGASPS